MQEGSTMVTPAPGYEHAEVGPPMTGGPPDQAQFEADKRSVYKHPLFPLLALLFERCEQATQAHDCPASDSFNMDIQAFVQHQERDRKPFLLDDPEVDALMIKAIQVLRIHLLELEKVQELCKDFCNRYITCLKSKMQSENLLRSDYSSSALEANNNSSSGHSSNSNSPGFNTHSLQVIPSPVGGVPSESGPVRVLMSPSATGDHPPGGGGAGGGEVTAGGYLLQPGVLGSTPLSQIGANPCPPPSHDSLLGQLSPAPTTPGSLDEDDDFLNNKKKQKRGILPKQATSVMRSWLFQHLVHPYPTEDEKRQIAGQTNLTLLQVNNWFINARRRILQPMLDASSEPGAKTAAHKKSSKSSNSSGTSNSSKQRFWPDNLAQLHTHQAFNDGEVGLTSDSESDSLSEGSSDELGEEKPAETGGDQPR